MTTTIADIRKALAKESRDMELARELAATYVREHPEEFADAVRLSRDENVAMVSICRKLGRDDDADRHDIWVLCSYEPQHITGAVSQTVRPPTDMLQQIVKKRINGQAIV